MKSCLAKIEWGKAANSSRTRQVPEGPYNQVFLRTDPTQIISLPFSAGFRSIPGTTGNTEVRRNT